ncbi:uncharacterized protein PRCAT00005111001 [Priceomyces carsonii]|uniref:uncharacterized protein n=1 Tax=Priceomyces carsonii TaxID=28549 RepID=UPI002ED9CD25|nr:unnamed protein product [Priceomyces carsonii]
MASKLPWSVRATDAVHRITVLGLVGICAVGIWGIGFNVWANSDFSKMNKKKLTFEEKQYTDMRLEENDDVK